MPEDLQFWTRQPFRALSVPRRSGMGLSHPGTRKSCCEPEFFAARTAWKSKGLAK